MFKINLYNQEGKVIGKVDLDPEVFSVKPNETLIYQALVSQQNNMRSVIAHTKTRSERRGGGKKPWNQKGTGRARTGSLRSPIFKKGGITFGPRNERNYKTRVNKKIKKKAICMLFSDRVKEEKLKIVDKLELKEFKTKKAEEVLKNLSLDDKVLIVLAKSDFPLIKSFSNLQGTKTIPVNQLNILDLLDHHSLLVTKEALEKVTANCKI
ncbi:50S ribosomal protein L4 [Patescibacteria group bacterium]